jgi:hypothetical protein
MNTDDPESFNIGRAVPITPGDTPDRTPPDRTPPQLRDAIDSITEFEYTPYIPTTPQPGQTPQSTDDEELAAYMMFGSRASSELPDLRTEAWPYTGKRPNPISISKARKILAAAYATVPCEISEAGIHGHAWMIETDTAWRQRSGVTTSVTPPEKPPRETDYDVKKQMAYADKLETYKLYHHLVQEGKAKIITWFGKAMFVDLYEDDLLPANITPVQLLDHLGTTYSQGRDYRRHMEQVEKDFNAPYNPREPVETYFMKLQEARAHADLLGQPYTEQQTMNRALTQFEQHHEKDAYKAEKRWNERDGATDWAAFKVFWKDEIHQWDTILKPTRH